MKPSHFDKHGRLRVLVVDDDSVNLMVVESMLKPMGWDVVTAMDGAEAYAAVDEEETWPDLVLLDYNLEVGDSGEEVLASLLRRFGRGNVPVVMCTAMSANSVELDRCLAAGAAGVLLKPYERSAVVRLVEGHCGAKVHARSAPSASAPAPAAAAPAHSNPGPSSPQSAGDVESFCSDLGLGFVGKKLKEQGLTLSDLAGLDDAALRKLGVVVKAQRDKILEAARSL